MPQVVQRAPAVCSALDLAEKTFGNVVVIAKNGGCKWTVNLQKQFKAQAIAASRNGESIWAALKHWRHQVECGEVDFDSRQEEDFKAAISAFVALSSFFVDKFESHKAGCFLTHPRYVSALESYKGEAEKILASWQSPEREAAEAITAEWDDNFPDDETLAEIGQLEERLATQVHQTGRVDPEDRRRYEELQRKYRWGEKLGVDD